jgi:hypothetical protein
LPSRADGGFIQSCRNSFSHPADENSMRNLFALLALIGVAGIALGTLTLVHAAHGPTGRLGFTYENYGGPGSILAGVTLLAVSLYLRSAWRRRD